MEHLFLLSRGDLEELLKYAFLWVFGRALLAKRQAATPGKEAVE